MSLLPSTFFPRSMMDWDWPRRELSPMTPSWDLFDPFHDLDKMLNQNFMWLNEPKWLRDVTSLIPSQPEKYRITVDITGFDPKSIKTEIKDNNKLIVSGHEGKSHETEDYTLKEFRRSYNLPKNIETDKLVSYVTGNDLLVIEFPYKREERQRGDLLPRIVDVEGGGKRVEMNFPVPENIDPKKIHVTCRDRDIIVRANYKDEKPDQVSRVHYYRRTTLPENTDFNQVKCVYDNNQLSITAPINLEFSARRRVPIQMKEKQPQLQQGTTTQPCPTCAPGQQKMGQQQMQTQNVPVQMGQQGEQMQT